MKQIMAEQEREKKNFQAQQKKEYKINKEQIKKVHHDSRPCLLYWTPSHWDFLYSKLLLSSEILSFLYLYIK